jgi:hypothetical protein
LWAVRWYLQSFGTARRTLAGVEIMSMRGAEAWAGPRP